MNYYTSLEDAITNESSDIIIESLQKSKPVNSKVKVIRSSASNSFTYTLNFSESISSASVKMMESGEIHDVEFTEVMSIKIFVNSVEFGLPFQVKKDDNVDVMIEYEGSASSAQVKLIAREFNNLIIPFVSDNTPSSVENLKCWINSDEGISINYQSGFGNVDGTQSSDIITASITNGASFSIEDIGKKIRITDSNDILYEMIIVELISAFSVRINEPFQETDTDMNLEFGYVQSWKDMSKNQPDFMQDIENLQPIFYDDFINNHGVVFFDTEDFMSIQSMFIPERTIYAVLRSIETSTSNYNYTFFGDYVDGGTAFREWADGTDQALVADNKNQKGNQQLKDTMASMKTVRTDFHIVVLKQSATNSLLRVDETDITSLSTDIGSIAPQSFFSIGSQGDGNNGAKCYIAELLVYDRVHTIKETEVIENYLQVKYDL